jgi:hypothetical protein
MVRHKKDWKKGKGATSLMPKVAIVEPNGDIQESLKRGLKLIGE